MHCKSMYKIEARTWFGTRGSQVRILSSRQTRS